MTALDGVTLHLEPGECLGLLGPNGAGKSTLIRSIVGRVAPDAGTIALFGSAADSAGARTALGWVPQDWRFIPGSRAGRTWNRSADIADSRVAHCATPWRGASAGRPWWTAPPNWSKICPEA